MPQFERYIGIDYSGAKTPEAQLPGLRVYMATPVRPPTEVAPPVGRRCWSRQDIAEWLCGELVKTEPAIVGIDHAFSFPLPYFEAYGLAHDWPAFLDDFQRHWPTDQPHSYVDFVRDGEVGQGELRQGATRWRRLTDRRAGPAKSVFHFDVPGSVAKSTHAGLPWLRLIRQRLPQRVHFWPFDGWDLPPGRSVVAEAYPVLWSRAFPRADRTSDQHDAYSIAAWLRLAELNGTLEPFLRPELKEDEEPIARIEGWILGVA